MPKKTPDLEGCVCIIYQIPLEIKRINKRYLKSGLRSPQVKHPFPLASPLLYGGEPSLCVFHHPKGVYQMRGGRVLVKKVALKDNLKTVIQL